ncbi:NAD-binding protein, partial [Streptomyces caeruleatus]
VVDTWGAWSLPEQPKSIAVVGAGASGAEIASAYARYGTEVTLIEMLPQILPAEDKDIVRVVERAFKKQGIEISTGT